MFTTNIRSVKLHNPEPLHPATDGDGWERDYDATTSTTRDTPITYTVSVQVFKAPAPDHLNDEAFRVVVAQPMAEIPGRTLYTFTEAGGLVVGKVSAHFMDAYTVGMPPLPPPPPIPQLIPPPQNPPVPLPHPPLTPVPSPCTPSPHCGSPGEIPTTRSHSTGEKYDFHGRKCFEDHSGVKQNINGPNPFCQ